MSSNNTEHVGFCNVSGLSVSQVIVGLGSGAVVLSVLDLMFFMIVMIVKSLASRVYGKINFDGVSDLYVARTLR